MAKQLGDQGSLSKNLQEKEGVGYRRARPGLGFSDSSPPKLDSGSERFCLASSGMGSSLLGLALLRMCTLCSSWYHGCTVCHFSPGQAAQPEHRSETIPRPFLFWAVCNFVATYAAYDIQSFRGQVWGKEKVRGA